MPTMTRAILLVPEEGDPCGLLAPGPCGALPPMAFEYVCEEGHCNWVSGIAMQPASIICRSCRGEKWARYHRRGLPLFWDDIPVQMGLWIATATLPLASMARFQPHYDRLYTCKLVERFLEEDLGTIVYLDKDDQEFTP